MILNTKPIIRLFIIVLFLTACRQNNNSCPTTEADTIIIIEQRIVENDTANVPVEEHDTQIYENEYGFVNLTDIVSDAMLEMRYYGTYNFVGTRLDGYEEPVALLTRRAAEALLEVSKDVDTMGYRLKIYDAYRPKSAVRHIVRWAGDRADTLMKPYFYPNLDKSVLFESGYLSSRSRHSRGSTVDLTLFDMATGKELDMGTPFDWLGVESHPSYRATLTIAQHINRMTLRKAMMRHGFKPCGTEWWHFTLIDEPYPNKGFDFPVRRIERQRN